MAYKCADTNIGESIVESSLFSIYLASDQNVNNKTFNITIMLVTKSSYQYDTTSYRLDLDMMPDSGLNQLDQIDSDIWESI